MRHLSRVGNLGAGDGPNLLGRQGNDGRRLAGECNKLDLKSLMAGINMHDCPNIAGLKTLLGKSGCQNDSIVFVNHA